MRYTQDSGVRRKDGSDEYKVVVSVYLDGTEKDLWGAGKLRLALVGIAPENAGDTWLDDLARASISAAQAKFGGGFGAQDGTP